MKTKPILLVAILTAALFSSCLPRERMAWSPDGSRVAVATRDGLVLADAEGRPLGPIDTDGGLAATHLDGSLAWSRDGKDLFLVTQKKGLTWKDAAKWIPAKEATRVDALVKTLPHTIRARRQALSAGENNVSDVMSHLVMAEEPLLFVALRAAFEADPDAVKALFVGLEDEKEVVDALEDEQLAIMVYQLRRQPIAGAGQEHGAATILQTSLLPLGHLAPSPDGSRLAFTRGTEAHQSIEHVATSSDGSSPPVVVYPKLGAHDFAWAPDGSRLLVARLFDKEMPLGRIESVAAVPGTDDKDPRLLAEAMMADPPSLAVLPDGSILFPASPVTYPVAGGNQRPAPAFHRVLPDGSSLTRIPTADGALPGDLRFFAVSPDGRHAAMVESGSTTVATLDLITGEVKSVASPSAGWKCLTRPAWRDNTEFTYAAESDGKPMVMLHSLASGSKPWGGGFPDGAFSEWLEPPDEK